MLSIKLNNGNKNESCKNKYAKEWTCDVTRLDIIRNDYIKRSLGITAEKMEENRLRFVK